MKKSEIRDMIKEEVLREATWLEQENFMKDMNTASLTLQYAKSDMPDEMEKDDIRYCDTALNRVIKTAVELKKSLKKMKVT